MEFVVAIYPFCFVYLVMSLLLHIAAQFLLIYHPTIILTIQSVHFLFFLVFAGGQAAIELSFDCFDFIFIKLVPN